MRSKQGPLFSPLMLKGTMKFTHHSENTITDTEMGGDLSTEDKGSQLPMVSKALERRVVQLPFQGKKVMTSLW